TAELKLLLLGEADYEKTEHYPLSWEQIKEMAEFGVQFGAHTCSHINLSHADEELIRREITASKEVIQTRLGREIKGFAYPYGYDPPGYARLIPLLRELGFDYACTSWWGNNPEDTELYLLFRNSLPLIISPALLGRELHINMAEDERPPYFTEA
ncbi:MAG: polysaccharide deacetylase family protein, partial [candidate division Zixibacteria bacterium]|nr:polysaccharide deacetylase family protein [candidate division Zixibacteria bacterium]